MEVKDVRHGFSFVQSSRAVAVKHASDLPNARMCPQA